MSGGVDPRATGRVGTHTQIPAGRPQNPYAIPTAQLHHLINQAWNHYSSGGYVTAAQNKAALSAVFQACQHVPQPDDNWYRQVFDNFDPRKTGYLNYQNFFEIVTQYCSHHAEKLYRRAQRQLQQQQQQQAGGSSQAQAQPQQDQGGRPHADAHPQGVSGGNSAPSFPADRSDRRATAPQDGPSLSSSSPPANGGNRGTDRHQTVPSMQTQGRGGVAGQTGERPFLEPSPLAGASDGGGGSASPYGNGRSSLAASSNAPGPPLLTVQQSKGLMTTSGDLRQAELSSRILFPHSTVPRAVFAEYEFVPEGGGTFEVLGSGAFGRVVKVRHRRSGERRACKSIALQCEEQWELVKSEIETLKNLDHPNIMKLFETYHDGHSIFLIMELLEGGQLFDRMTDYFEKRRERITELKVAAWTRQLLSACAYCHERGVVHRDMKPENALFLTSDDDSPLKVIDFGLASTLDKIQSATVEEKRERTGISGAIARLLPSINGKRLMSLAVKRTKMQRAGTVHYMAPEMVKGNYDAKVDVFSIGVILYQLLTGVHPFFVPGMDNEESVKEKILNVEPPLSGDCWDAFVSPQAKDLLRQMLQKNPKKRLTARQALDHPWFTMQTAKATQSTLTPSVFDGLLHFKSHNQLVQAALRLMAKNLNDKDIQEIHRKFSALDTQKCGMITVSELKDAMRDLVRRRQREAAGAGGGYSLNRWRCRRWRWSVRLCGRGLERLGT